MPRSRSRSLLSITRSTTRSLARKMPLWCSIASTSVVLPWSTCATMATLRRQRVGDTRPGFLRRKASLQYTSLEGPHDSVPVRAVCEPRAILATCRSTNTTAASAGTRFEVMVRGRRRRSARPATARTWSVRLSTFAVSSNGRAAAQSASRPVREMWRPARPRGVFDELTSRIVTKHWLRRPASPTTRIYGHGRHGSMVVTDDTDWETSSDLFGVDPSYA